jgi:hypothetical protein
MMPHLMQRRVPVSLFPLFDDLEFTVYKPSDRALTVRFDPDQQTGRIGRFVMRIREAYKMIGDALPAFPGIHGKQAVRKRPGIPGTAKRQCLVPTQKRFDRAAQPGPEFYLSRNGSFRDFPREPGVENQGVRDFNRLTHAHKVAKRYPPVKRLVFGRKSPGQIVWVELQAKPLPLSFPPAALRICLA